MQHSSEVTFRRCPAPYRVVADGMVVAVPSAGSVRLLSSLVALIWQATGEGANRDQLDAELAIRFPTVARGERRAALDDALGLLEREELVERSTT